MIESLLQFPPFTLHNSENRSLLNYVPRVLSCPTYLTCPRASRASCSTCLMPYVLSSPTCLVLYALSCPTFLVSYVPRVLRALVPYVSLFLCGLVPRALWALFPYVSYCQYYFEVAISIYQQYDIFELFETKYENMYIRNCKLFWYRWGWI